MLSNKLFLESSNLHIVKLSPSLENFSFDALKLNWP